MKGIIWIICIYAGIAVKVSLAAAVLMYVVIVK